MPYKKPPKTQRHHHGNAQGWSAMVNNDIYQHRKKIMALHKAAQNLIVAPAVALTQSIHEAKIVKQRNKCYHQRAQNNNFF